MKIDLDSISSQFKELNNDEIRDIIVEYFEDKPIANIISENRINGVSEKKLIKAFPRLIFHNKCSKCGGEVRTRLLSRNGEYRSEDICLNCSFTEYVEHEELNNILADSVAVKAIASHYENSDAKRCNYQGLNLKERTLIAALLWQVKKMDNRLIPQWKKGKLNIVSDHDDSYEYFRLLAHRNVVCVSPTSKKEGFRFDENQEPTFYYIDYVDYILNINNVGEKELYFPKVQKEKMVDEFYDCWVELGVSAIKQVIHSEIENLDLDELDIVLVRYLELFSIGSVVLLAKEAVYKFYWCQQHNSDSSFKKVFVRHVEEAIVEERSVSIDLESLEYTNSYWYDVLFHKVTNLGSAGFEKVPNKDIEFMN
ncbi:hypothetical protein [Lactiplantibacillus paraplantarum]|uniref:hypothetical protein n=1 Tax=Lactiplantibacillus paraplantarum TaxID=60520 RepID=UPI0023AA50BF|nr:hypothetical protein [Lactiplantibacillus paraplantarum]WEE36045.1 hypothetical protein PWO93_00190 [Lactiplantibacillus paraplantarum]